MKKLDKEALEYHRRGRPGKLEVQPSKPVGTPRDLSLAYSPGVAAPCLEIARDADTVFEYTGRGNLVAVITNGTAVLGLGNIGPLAGKPVMEGKGVLFKRFADIDVFDIELDCDSTDELIASVKSLEPTFGGINLEDIAAPACFRIERELQEALEIPVFHDDQHGTAIIAGAALYNALELVGKDIADIRIAMNGAGAAGIATAELLLALGAKRENILLCDSKGVVFSGRSEGMNEFKADFANNTTARTLADALDGADVFIGCSVAGVVTQDMLRSMADRPIVFALANPDPEIPYPEALEARPDLIMATGRSDYPNQVNNVLGFPFIFRGALDVQARKVNNAMKIAAVKALAALAREDVPDSIRRSYDQPDMRFGPDYIIPKPFDRRVLLWVAPAVARAAVDSGVARKPIEDWDAYHERLERMLGRTHQIMRPLINRAKLSKKRIVFPEGARPRILRAARNLAEEGICTPILLGDPREIEYTLLSNSIELPDGVELVNPDDFGEREGYRQVLWELRKRKGLTPRDASAWLRNRNIFGMMMVRAGDADGVVTGLHYNYAEAIRPALQILGPRPQVSCVAGIYVMVLQERLLFFADCTVNVQPTSEQLAEIALNTAAVARTFDVVPKVAFLSFSNFGSTRSPETNRVRDAVRLLGERDADFEYDGEMQADIAFDTALREDVFPFCDLKGEPNVLVFPDLTSANIAYKLLTRLARATAIGPLLVGMSHPVNILQLGSDVGTIENIATITAVEAALGTY
ncbi:MAG: NADP-dependent malic enzyme [Deltaproteobacteria bacterium]|nr:NADP-dependent malic enzyme [Deltaproteobacteria bacterium]